VLFPVHPKTAAQYRETFCPSGAKSDPSDTASLLDLLERHREKLRPLRPHTAETRLLQLLVETLVETRRMILNEKTQQKNRLSVSEDLFSAKSCNGLMKWTRPWWERWGSLRELQGAHAGTLRKFFHQHNCRDEERIRERIAGIQQAVPATEDAALVEGEERRARTLVAVIETLRSQIVEYDRRIAELVEGHPEGSLFGSLPGAGPVLTPRLIVAFGTQRALLLLQRKVASRNICTCGRACPKVCGRRSTNSPTTRWLDRDRRRPTMMRREPKEIITTLLPFPGL
jgi:transposase